MDINLSLEAGSVLVMIGPNGAGKSTLIRAASGVIPVDAGRVTARTRPPTAVAGPAGSASHSACPLSGGCSTDGLPARPAFTVWETILMGRTPHLNFLASFPARMKRSGPRHCRKVDACPWLTGAWANFPAVSSSGCCWHGRSPSTPVLLLDEPAPQTLICIIRSPSWIRSARWPK